jgi:hypothetical protein
MTIALDVAKKHGEHILFKENNSNGSVEIRKEQVVITEQKIVSNRMTWVCGDI